MMAADPFGKPGFSPTGTKHIRAATRMTIIYKQSVPQIAEPIAPSLPGQFPGNLGTAAVGEHCYYFIRDADVAPNLADIMQQSSLNQTVMVNSLPAGGELLRSIGNIESMPLFRQVHSPEQLLLLRPEKALYISAVLLGYPGGYRRNKLFNPIAHSCPLSLFPLMKSYDYNNNSPGSGL